MKILIKNGLVLDPANGVQSKLNLLVENGKISRITREEPEADTVIDAANRVVCPGFIDIHMHEDPVESNGHIYADEATSIFSCMLRMGVTTAIAGNCGENVWDPGDYLDLVDQDRAAVNVGMFAGHQYFREAAGALDKYGPTTAEQRRNMTAGIARALERGCVGTSYGIRYIPGIDRRELLETAEPCKQSRKPISAHIRSDADEVFGAAEEFLDIAKKLDIPAQISHIGSMAGFGQMEDFLAMVDQCRLGGMDVSCDCYPYYAFSTNIGTTTYDDGWLERYRCGYDVVELCEGTYKGQRCSEETFREERREHPEYLTICHVMKEADVDAAFRHPNVMLGSDGILSSGQGHPRASGTFPRMYAHFVRGGKVSLYNAVRMMTSAPADKLGLKNKGRLNVGADADIVIFDPETIQDNATFEEPLLPPSGIDYVLIAGEIAAKDSRILNKHLGRAIRT